VACLQKPRANVKKYAFFGFFFLFFFFFRGIIHLCFMCEHGRVSFLALLQNSLDKHQPSLPTSPAARQRHSRRARSRSKRFSSALQRGRRSHEPLALVFRNPIAFPSLIMKNPFSFKAWNAVFQQSSYSKVWQPPKLWCLIFNVSPYFVW